MKGNTIAIIAMGDDNASSMWLPFINSGLSIISLADSMPSVSVKAYFQYGIRDVVFSVAFNRCRLAVIGNSDNTNCANANFVLSW